ncbi:hypothetical protein C2I18_15835 [Paenibacillus sp. PK3_47]|uniref:hypothetical protein n=1 Tax=Paenibacillus sp. PK3_47 TaxID=2072642 RepID=UPI00201D33C0|nr:hypothetical protein [Paenibacillus sp. PK3_47]UQZ34873.1 hypothetical protein C2I18_15835 [Paenibacillus sp. PK3_47]
MRITCYYGKHAEMGYIYLTPPKFEYNDEAHAVRNEIFHYVSADNLRIPLVTDIDPAPALNQMKLAANTFRSDYGYGYDTEFGNDMDAQGYLKGVELTLPGKRFVDLVDKQAFKIIQTSWKGRMFHLLTLDHLANVLHPGNVLYRMSDAEDAFVIVQLSSAENAGYADPDNKAPRTPIALFKGVLSAREDIYSLDYLMKPDFFMCED